MTPWVTRLLAANVVVYVLTRVLAVIPLGPLVLVPILVPVRPWTLVTYMFLHANFTHLLFNMLGLFFFGPRLEGRLGGRQFLWLYFASGLMGAALSIFTPLVAIVGASGAVFGVFLGFAMFWPRERIYIWGVFPVEARVLVAVMTALALFGGLTGGGGVAHFAHLGGFAGGYLYLKWLDRHSPAKKWRKKVEASARKSSGNAQDDLERWERIRREDLHQVNRAEFDRVLEKLHANGAGSLTPDERAFLDRFSPD